MLDSFEGTPWTLKTEVLARIESLDSQLAHYRSELARLQKEAGMKQSVIEHICQQSTEWRALADLFQCFGCEHCPCEGQPTAAPCNICNGCTL